MVKRSFRLRLSIFLRRNRNWRRGSWHVVFVIDNSRSFSSSSHRSFGRRRSQSRLPRHPLEIRIHDELPVVTQVHRFQLVKLLPPLLHVRDVSPVALEV